MSKREASSSVLTKEQGHSKRSRCALLVLGMHRSGTSALSGVLAKLGATPPRSLMAENEYNQRGYWESTPIVILHDAILKSAGSRWSDWSQFNADWFESSVSVGFEERLAELIADEYGSSEFFSVKDPRVSRFLPLWLRVFDKGGIAPKAIIPVRHPAEVVQSLHRRDNFGRSKGQLLWLRHVLDAELASRNIQRTFVRYEDLLADWKSTMRKAGRSLQVVWPRWSAEAEAEITNFLSSELRHHRMDEIREMEGSMLDEWVARTYAIIAGFADGESQDEQAFGVLDQIGHEFNRTAAIYAPVVREHELAEEEERSRMRARMQVETEKARNKAAAAEAALAEMERRALPELASLRAERDGLSASLLERFHEIAAIVQRMEVHRKEREGLELHASNLQRELDATRSERDSLAAEKKEQERIQVTREAVLSRQMEMQKSRFETDKKSMEQRIDVLSFELQTANSKLDGILRSNTWKIGRPFRVVRRLLAGAGAKSRTAWDDDVDRIRSSEMFDEHWYLAQYPDVAAIGLDPVHHYLAYGCREGRDPSPSFSTVGYYKAHPELNAGTHNALLHFLAHGGADG